MQLAASQEELSHMELVITYMVRTICDPLHSVVICCLCCVWWELCWKLCPVVLLGFSSV
jgi:hypothetical protein